VSGRVRIELAIDNCNAGSTPFAKASVS
jgi:hypothetical protein